MFVSREALLQDSETLVEHHEHKEAEARIVEADKMNNDPKTGGLFRGCFRTQPRRMGGIIDYEDGGITRCPNCAWELEGGFCAHCGIPIHDELTWSDDGGSLSNASESIDEMRMGTYSSDYDSLESDEAEEFATVTNGHEQRARLGRPLHRGNHEIGRVMGDVAAGRWGDRGDAYGYGHGRRDQDDGFSDQEIYSVGSTADAGDDNIAIGESEESNADADSSNESVTSSMRSFLEDDEHPFNHEHTFPANDTFWPGDGISDTASSHEASSSQNDWSDAHDDENFDDEPDFDQTDDYASAAGLSTPDRTYHCGTIPLGLTTTLLQENQSSALGASSSRHSSTLPLQEPATASANDSEASETFLPPPPQRNRKRRHVVEDEPSNDSSASDLDTRRPRKRKSSSQDTTAVDYPSIGSRAQDQRFHPSRRARGIQPSPIVIDSSPARPPSPNQARCRHRADRPRIASHLRRSASGRIGDTRALGNVENLPENPLPDASAQSDVHQDTLSPGQSRLDRLRGKAAVHICQNEQQRQNEGMELRL